MQRYPGILVFALCAIPRVLALFWFPPDTSVFYYWDASEGLLARGAPALDGVIDTSTEPLYPALLAVLRAVGRDSVTVVLLAQIAIASGAGVLLYRLTEDLAGSRVAAVTAALYAFDPYLVRQSASPVEITVCTALLIAAAWSYARGTSTAGAIGTGVLAALAALTRFSLLPVAAGGLGLLLRERRWRHAMAFAIAAAIPVGAWMLSTYATNGALVPTRVGINLFVSTCEYADQIVPLRNVDLLVPWAYEAVERELSGTPMSETDRQRALDDALLAKAVAFVREHPVTTVRLKLRNLAYTVAPVLLPLERKPRSAVATIEDGRVRISGLERRPFVDHALYSTSRLLLVAGACVGLWRRRGRWQRGDAMLVAIAASIVVVQAVFFPTSRLLAPMAFVLMIYCAIALTPRRRRAEA
jgi:4-amino-4-deoxy-L-arabinose transferase-like glycosyltransferase